MRELTLNAPAKINLALDVLGTLPNGYHEVRMVMQQISLSDTIRMTRTEEAGFRIESNVPGLPVDRGNLMYRAAELLFEEFGLSGGVTMALEKRIPVAAGLAGGSTDAAAVLRGVNELFELGLTREELMARGVRLGADVPYCLFGGTALAEGIGEKLTRLPDCVRLPLVIAKPPEAVSTKAVYEALREDEVSGHPDIDGMIGALGARDVSGIFSRMGNLLETVTVPMHPVIGTICRKMLENGAIAAMMSGSGPTVFAVFTDRETAEKAAESMKQENLCAFVETAQIA